MLVEKEKEVELLYGKRTAVLCSCQHMLRDWRSMGIPDIRGCYVA